MDLSKADKKVASRLIQLGLRREIHKILVETDSVLSDWKEKNLEDKDSYYLLYNKITDFDKHLQRRYDSLTGSRYYLAVLQLVYDGIVSEEELKDFSEDTKNRIIAYINMSR